MPLRDVQDYDDDDDSGDDYTFPFVILTLCWFVGFLSSLDRVAMSVAILPMATELGYSETIKGQISSFFSVGYGLAILPAGLVLAAVSPRLVMAVGISIWSLATLATPLTAAVAVSPLLAARASVGAAESVLLPSVNKLLANWVPPEKTSVALAFVYSGLQMGTVGAYLLSPSVMELSEGWRGLFLIYGGVGLLFLIPWLVFARDFPDTPKTNTATKVVTTRSSSSASSSSSSSSLPSAESGLDSSLSEKIAEATDLIKSAPIMDMFGSTSVQGIILAHAANNWGLYNNLAWTPTFYSQQYGLNVKDSAFLSILPSVAGIVGGFVAGASAEVLIGRLEEGDEEGLTNIRKLFQSIALFGPAACLATLSLHVPEQPWVAQGLLMGTVGLQAFNAAGYSSSVQEKAGGKWAGLLYSVTSLPGVVLGSIGVYVTGQILDNTNQDWSYVFALNSFVDVIGATAFVALYDSKREFD